MFRILIVSLLLSSVAALNIADPVADHKILNNVINFHQNIPLANQSTNFREAAVSKSATRWPWSISDDQIHVEFLSNSGKRTVETLANSGEGAGYMGEITVGGQTLTAIWDTGSDQQVVNSVRTMNLLRPCMMAQDHCYNNQKSTTYSRLSPVPRKISYGSGDTFVLLGQEEIGSKGGAVRSMPFYELLTTNIPNILTHELDVVAGMGPRGWKGVTLLKSMQVDYFSFCFPADNRKNGYLIWNDRPPPAHFNRMVVPGEAPTYWSLKANEFALRSSKGSAPMSFDGECVVDSGTSLITLDKESLRQVTDHLDTFDKKSGFECNDKTLNQFPDLTFKLQGKDHRFRAHDYMMYTETDDEPDFVNPFLLPFKMGQQGGKSSKKCVLMFTPPMEKGMCILGMPFMRNYYTTFNRPEGTVNTMLHDGMCNMGRIQNFRQKLETESPPMTLRRIDTSKLQFSDGFMRLWDKHQAAEKALEKAVDAAAAAMGIPQSKDGLLLKQKVDEEKDGVLELREKLEKQ